MQIKKFTSHLFLMKGTTQESKPSLSPTFLRSYGAIPCAVAAGSRFASQREFLVKRNQARCGVKMKV